MFRIHLSLSSAKSYILSSCIRSSTSSTTNTPQLVNNRNLFHLDVVSDTDILRSNRLNYPPSQILLLRSQRATFHLPSCGNQNSLDVAFRDTYLAVSAEQAISVSRKYKPTILSGDSSAWIYDSPLCVLARTENYTVNLSKGGFGLLVGWLSDLGLEALWDVGKGSIRAKEAVRNIINTRIKINGRSRSLSLGVCRNHSLADEELIYCA